MHPILLKKASPKYVLSNWTLTRIMMHIYLFWYFDMGNYNNKTLNLQHSSQYSIGLVICSDIDMQICKCIDTNIRLRRTKSRGPIMQMHWHKYADVQIHWQRYANVQWHKWDIQHKTIPICAMTRKITVYMYRQRSFHAFTKIVLSPIVTYLGIGVFWQLLESLHSAHLLSILVCWW